MIVVLILYQKQSQYKVLPFPFALHCNCFEQIDPSMGVRGVLHKMKTWDTKSQRDKAMHQVTYFMGNNLPIQVSFALRDFFHFMSYLMSLPVGKAL
jgi:hypothetical protein